MSKKQEKTDSREFLKCQNFATKAIHTNIIPELWTGYSVVPGIIMSTTYKQSGPNINQVIKII